DAAAGDATLQWSAEARKQAILADVLVVTKTDLVPEADAAALIAKLRALNPRAAIDKAVNGALDPRRLIEAGTGARGGFVAEANHSDGIGSFVIAETAPIKWPAFAQALDTLQSLRGPDLLRVKGILNIEGCQGPVVMQMVQHLIHPLAELEAWPDSERTSRLVFITRNVPENRVRELIAAVRALA